MKFLKKLPILIMLLMLSLSIGFFLPQNNAVEQNASAAISGLSAERVNFVGKQGNMPYHYFSDFVGETLVDVSTVTGSYKKEDGSTSSEFYILKASREDILDGFSRRIASGSASFLPTREMLSLATDGGLYVQARFGVASIGKDANDRVQFDFTVGDQTITTFSSGAGTRDNPEWYTTEYVKIDPSNSEIGFMFSSCGSGNYSNPCEFEIYEPELFFKVVLTSVEMDTTEKTVYPGCITVVPASNLATKQTGNSEYLKYYRNIFHLNYEIVEGGDFATVNSLGTLTVNKQGVPDGAKIVVKASSKSSSLTGETGTIESETKTYIVDTKKYEVKVGRDFKNPATFAFEGEYYQGQRIMLSYSLNQNFKFNGWTVNGVEVADEVVPYEVKESNVIFCNFTKSIELTLITATKIYDGTTAADLEGVFDGVEEGHDVKLSGITGTFITANVGEDKPINIEGAPSLTGDNANLYTLSNTSLPEARGRILQRDITVTANEQGKTYGEADMAISYSIEGTDENLLGALEREPGEIVGNYNILIGNLVSQNPNFNITFIPSIYTIKVREVSIDLEKIEKVYDGNDTIDLNASLKNVVAGDELYLNFSAHFESVNAGLRKIIIDQQEIFGSAVNNYVLIELDEEDIQGEIKQKPITVEAKSVTITFGDSDKPLEYEVNGLVGGETLLGSLSREEGRNVGEYNILIGNLVSQNPNYQIAFTSDKYIINKKAITVKAKDTTKTYGDPDEDFEYDCEEVVEWSPLVGSLSREVGIDIGTYQINQGTLDNTNNPNYDITFIPATLEITPRHASVVITPKNKVYDKTVRVEFDVDFVGLVYADSFTFNATLEFEDPNAAENKAIIYRYTEIIGDKKANYIFSFPDNLRANIDRKDVYLIVDAAEKVYGERDPIFNYRIEGVIEGDLLSVNLTRENNQNVGEYPILPERGYNDQNTNYNIIYQQTKNLKITPASLRLIAGNYTKTYGEDDQDFEVYLVDENDLKYDDTLEEVVQGRPERDISEGNHPGLYVIKIGSITANDNYIITEFIEGSLRILKKDIVVKAKPAQKTYGDEDPIFDYDTEGTVYDDVIVLKLIRGTYGEDVGTYEITYENLYNADYNITFIPNILEITKREIKIKADPKTKTYGSKDPEYSVSVVDGELAASDVISEISKGSLLREEGENRGTYAFLQNDFNLGNNYNITEFISDYLTIAPCEIEITADRNGKVYGNEDGYLSYKITQGSCKFDDILTGSLFRAEGEGVGEYQISIGSLSFGEKSENYIIKFVSNVFKILARPITIRARAATKTFGDENDPELTYDIEGGIDGKLCFEDDVLEGSLEREKPTSQTDPKYYENAGRYVIYSTLNNPNYEITYIQNYLTIKPREIMISADYKSITYGQEDIALTYTIKNPGDIQPGDSISGELFRAEGNTVGQYEISGKNLSLGRNYKIVFTKGIFEILPIDIYVTLEQESYQKTYGSADPEFKYSVSDGLINDDYLIGGISREGGEDVGRYRLVSAFNNINYNVILNESYLVIRPKEVVLNIVVLDKVYSGDKSATIRQPTVSGVIDNDITIEYDVEKCAVFTSGEVGNNIPVIINKDAFKLVGEKAKNYSLQIPSNLTANITYQKLAADQDSVILETQKGTDLNYGTIVQASLNSFDASTIDELNKEVVSTFSVWLENEGEVKDISSAFTLSFEIPAYKRGRSNYYIYSLDEYGNKKLLSYKIVGNYLQVNVDRLGKFIILTDNEDWLDVGSYISIIILVALATLGVIYLIRKKSGKKKKKSK